MAFWGVEVKSGKPYTHIFDGLKGRLHISMATLGTGTAKNKSMVQCNVGNKSPIYLCSLFPEKSESMQINVEFEEAEEVIFSVLGPRSVHLCGHYLDGRRRHNSDDNSESYGEDIAESDTQRSVDGEEDQYDDSFIDDTEPGVLPASSVSNSGDSSYVEEVSDRKKPQKEKGSHRRLRKKYQVSESEVESEDEDRCPISSFYKTKSATINTKDKREEKSVEGTVDTSSKKTEDDIFAATESNKDVDDVDIDGQSKRQFDLPADPLPRSSEVCPENGIPKRKRKEQSKEGKALETIVLEKEDEAQKEEATTQNSILNFYVEDRKEQKVANVNEAKVLDDLSKLVTDVRPENGERPKKKRKKRVEEQKFELVSTNYLNEDKGQQDEAKGDLCPDLLVSGEQTQKSAKDGSSGIHDANRSVDGKSDEKKVKKKKKSKSQAHGEAVNTDVPLLSAEENVDTKSSQVKTFPGGLHIEELKVGKPDGKIATSGKKISIHYVSKLKENGRLIDSTVGRDPLKFRLGQGEVMNGLDIGVDGMRVGEKRRLVIPPPMGFGSEGQGKTIPPNSWLVFEVELVKVR